MFDHFKDPLYWMFFVVGVLLCVYLPNRPESLIAVVFMGLATGAAYGLARRRLDEEDW